MPSSTIAIIATNELLQFLFHLEHAWWDFVRWFVFGLVTVLVLVWFKRVPGTELEPDALHDEMFVVVSYRTLGMGYGRDIGYLSFQDGWLFFRGERSTFSLGSQDFNYRDKPVTSLSLSPMGLAVEVQLETFGRSALELFDDIRKWSSQTVAPKGTAVVPPISCFEPDGGLFGSVTGKRPYVLSVAVAVSSLVALLGFWLAGFVANHSFVVWWLLAAIGGSTWVAIRVRRNQALASLSQLIQNLTVR